MTIHNPYLAEVIALRARVEELEAEIAARNEHENAHVEALMRNLKVTVYQARMLMALATGHICTRERLSNICQFGDFTSDRNVDSHVKRIRMKRIKGVNIQNVYGVGYCLAPESVPVVRAAMAATH